MEEQAFLDLLQPYHQITENILLGNQQAAGWLPEWERSEKALQEGRIRLQELGVTHILCCADSICVYPNEFTYKALPIRDSPGFNISEFFEEAYEFIEHCMEQNGTILIHCNAGASRSASILIYYIMRKKTLSLADAEAFVSCKRTCINPSNFRDQLLQAEGECATKKQTNP